MRTFLPLLALALAAGLAACAPADEPADAAPDAGDASDEQHEAMMRRVYQAFETGDTAVIDSAFAEGFVEHEELPGLEPGREGVKAFIGMWRSAFPDFDIEVHRILTDGDLAAAHATFSGTHRGEFFGIPATGRRIAVPTVDIVRFEGGRAVEHWGVTNEAVLLRQLGVIPEEEAPPAAEPAAAAPADTTR